LTGDYSIIMAFFRRQSSSNGMDSSTSSQSSQQRSRGSQISQRSSSSSSSSSSRRSLSTAELQRSALGGFMGNLTYRLRNQEMTYRPAIYQPTRSDDYIMMLPGKQQNFQRSQEDSLNGWNNLSFFGPSGKAEYIP
jgi:hypothetical protein